MRRILRILVHRFLKEPSIWLVPKNYDPIKREIKMKEWYIEREEKRPEEIEYIVEDNDDGNEFNHHNKDR